MNIFEKWKQRRTSRSQGAAANYWNLICDLASDKLSESKAEVALEAVEKLLNDVGKTENDVALDIQLARDFAAAKAADAEAAEGRATAADLRRDVARLEERARQLEEETKQLWQKAEEAASQANGLAQAAAAAAQALAKCRARLVHSGHPEFGARATEDAKAREVEQLLGELTNLEHGFGHNLASGASPLHSRRGEIAARLAALGHPVDAERLAKPLPGRDSTSTATQVAAK